VCGASGERIFSGEAGDVDDVASAFFPEAVQGFTGAVERAIQIQVDVAMPFFRRHFTYFAKDALARIVHEDVAMAEGGIHTLEEALDIVRTSHIGRRTEDFAPAGGL